MVRRKIIRIDEEKCTGCGECVTACAEGAIKIEGGKARVVSDRFCDGLGACIGTCPAGALTIEEREAEEFDLASAEDHKTSIPVTPCTAAMILDGEPRPEFEGLPEAPGGSQLSGWPVQIRLVRPTAPYLKDASLLIAGDCTGFACPDIHGKFIKGRTLLVGCPKLDDREEIVDRLSQIIRRNDIKDVTVLHMTVPCCANLSRLVGEAVKRSGKDLPVNSYAVDPRGGVEVGVTK